MTRVQTIIKKNLFFVILLTIIGGFFYFYNLNWGAPFYFHPDERNIASSVFQLQFPNQMNPHFFAYGSLPIYVTYFTGVFTNYITYFLTTNHQPLITTFEQAIQISRFYSALFATLLIPLLFVIARSIATKQSHKEASLIGIIAAFLATTSVGFMQFAHFGTFEMWLTFFSVLLFWLCLQKINYKTIILMGIVFGILVATKISSLILLPIPIVIIILKTFQMTSFWGGMKRRLQNLLTIFKNIILFLITALFIYAITNPFVFLDFTSFRGSMDYETNLAIGTLPVFYTGEFFNTIPVIFQFTHIYPFLLNPLLTFLFIPSSLYLIFKAVKTKNTSFMILNLFFLILFLSQTFLFAKWTRYMVPTLPFIYLIISFAISHLSFRAHSRNLNKRSLRAVITLVGMTSLIFAISYFITAFVHEDTRVAAYTFAKKTIPINAKILSEVYDLGIVPFNDPFGSITLYNFYDLDNGSSSPELLQELLHDLNQSDYIILPSQRILKTRLLNKEKFPVAQAFYQQLTTNHVLYQKIYETPCDIFCKITYLGDPIFRYEQTANVFDRPTVFIFKKL